VARARLTTRRLLGLDRSGPPAPQTLSGQPLNPWTIPNAIGFARLALLPVFLVVALSDDDGQSTSAFVIYAFVAGTDYLDGMAARITGQYSRLGTLLDPLTDRALVLSGAIVAWKFETLPRWALAVLAAREALMLILTRIALKRGFELQVKMLGRWAVWPVMSALALALVTDSFVPEAVLYFGLALTIGATAEYIADGVRFAKERPSSSS
jgi:CDP-diacylglycerol--glycerol-3-phosphate 3-phosphatidyltransferase